MLPLALKGLAVGVLCGLPFGPAGILCLHRTLRRGRRAGLDSAMGIAAAHALWCLAVASQLEVAADWLTAHGQWLRAGLGGLLCWLGGRAWTCGRSADAGLTDTGPAAAGFAPTLAVVGVNPATVLTVAAAISIVGVDIRGLSLWQSCGLAAAMFAGGAMLWCLLTVVFAYLGRHGDTVIMFRVRRGLAGLLLTLGIVNLVASLAVRP